MRERTYLVSVNDTVVGHLWGDGVHSLFSLHQQYLNAADRPVLGQYFEDRLQKKARRILGMHPWFENVLPEQSGALRKRYGRILNINPADSMALLAVLGNDLPGAVRVHSDTGEPPQSEVIDEERPGPLSQARFSLGGMQLKFSMSGELDRLSVGVADKNGTAWILKIGTPDLPQLAENEHSIMNWCRASGFDVPETHIIPIDQLPDLGSIPDTPYGYLIQRYDRQAGRRIHQEDFAQILNTPPERKYQATDAAGLLALARQVMGVAGAEEGLRRLTVAVATGNCDAHLKNWSVIYPDGVTAEWSPLYDQVCTIAYSQIERRLPLRIGDARHMNQVDIDHLRWAGKKADMSASRCEELIVDAINALARSFAVQADMPSELVSCLREHWKSVPVLKRFSLGSG